MKVDPERIFKTFEVKHLHFAITILLMRNQKWSQRRVSDSETNESTCSLATNWWLTGIIVILKTWRCYTSYNYTVNQKLMLLFCVHNSKNLYKITTTTCWNAVRNHDSASTMFYRWLLTWEVKLILYCRPQTAHFRSYMGQTGEIPISVNVKSLNMHLINEMS